MSTNPSPHLRINPPPLPSTASPTATAGFTPRSTTIPDNIDSDDEDVYDPTPVHSPGGPRYDDLPPSYDEAQQQALRDARNRVPPLNPDGLEMNRLTLDERPGYEIPGGADVRAREHAASETSRNARGVGMNVPVQQVGGSESVAVGRMHGENATTRWEGTEGVDQAHVLLGAALQFARQEPDADGDFAPKLGRCVVVPQTGIAASERKGKARRDGRAGRSGCGRTRSNAQVPGAWPGASPSTETLPADETGGAQEPAQFARAYAQTLHAHSIRPAEFLDFLDGLNALCSATNCTSADLVRADVGSDATGKEIVRNYVDTSNEVFFAPRGLKVSIRSLASVLDIVRMPEERGQRAAAVASVLDAKSTPAKRAQALCPWVEPLEMNVAEPSIGALMLREMSERFRSEPPTQTGRTRHESTQQPVESEKSRLEREYAARDAEDPPHSVPAEGTEDPPHSIPGEFPQSNTSQRPSFGGWPGRGTGGRGGPWTPFGAPGHGPFGPPGHGPHGPPGFGPFGPWGHTPWGPPDHGPHGPPGHGPFGPPGAGPWNFQPRGGPGAGGNGWEALGQSLGRWGEEFGKRMEIWGEQLGREAEAFSRDLSERVTGANAGGIGVAGPSRQPEASSSNHQASVNTGGLHGQETGVHHNKAGEDHVAAALDKHAEKQATRRQNINDNDTSSISSISSSSSTSSTASTTSSNHPPTTLPLPKPEVQPPTEKLPLEPKAEQKRTKRAIMREFRARKRELKREHRQTRRELRKRGLGKKSVEWKEARRGYRERKRALGREREEVKRGFRGEGVGERVRQGEGESVVWLVVEDLEA